MSLKRYYISRLILSAIFGGLFALSGATWWRASIAGAIAFTFFLWAPHSGRYSVHPERGFTALQRDERTQAFNDKAARNAFITCMLAVAAIDIYFGSLMPGDVPTVFLHYILILGVLTYFLSDFWLRKVE
jgi:hypothetical protein